MIEIYTDGACSGNGKENAVGGWAFVVVKKGKQEHSEYGGETGTTNNQMELTAVLKALLYFEKNMNLTDTLRIKSDSAYIIDCLNKGWYKKWKLNGWKNSSGEPVKNRELWENILGSIDNIGKSTIDFIKVKGHSGNKYNEIADVLAVKGAKEKK